MATLRQLEPRLVRTAARLVKGVGRTVQELAIAIGEDLVPATPVLTGFARANWRPAIGAPATVPVTALDPSGSATIAKIAAVAKRARPGDTIFLVNNAPYIGALNGGSSPQAPPGFVEAAVRTGTEKGLEKLRRGLL